MTPPGRVRATTVSRLLGLGAFVVGTGEVALAGLLPELGSSLAVTPARAGQVVTVFGLTAAVTAPLVTAGTVRWPRRRLLLLALGLYGLGGALGAVSPSFELLLTTQVITAAGAGLFLPSATVSAAGLAETGRRGRAVATVTTGMTVAIALGAPLGTTVAALAGWRATMAALTALATVVAVAVLVLVPPSVAANDEEPPSLRARMAPLLDPRVLALLATTLVGFTAIYIPYTYISVVAAEATHSDGLRLSAVLATLGGSGVVGNLLAGWLTDRYGGRVVVAAALAGLLVLFLLTPWWSAALITTLLAAAAYGLVGFGVSAPQTHRLLALGGDPSLRVALNGATLYLAIALSGVLGASFLTAAGASWLGPVAAAGCLLALGCSELAHRVIRSR